MRNLKRIGEYEKKGPELFDKNPRKASIYKALRGALMIKCKHEFSR